MFSCWWVGQYITPVGLRPLPIDWSSGYIVSYCLLLTTPTLIPDKGGVKMDRETMTNEENYCFDLAGYLHVAGDVDSAAGRAAQ